MGTDYLRNLPVPFFSQRKNKYIYEGVYTKEQAEKLNNNSLEGKKYQISMACNSCNITSVWMILRYFGVSIINPDAIMKEYKEKIPAQFIEIWKNYGFGTFLNGFLRIINPNDYMDFTQKSYFEKKSIPLLVTALGDIIVWEDNAYFFILQYRYNNFSSLARGFKVFEKLLDETEYFFRKVQAKNFNEALQNLGAPAYDECFGYVPLLSLGGSEKPENLQKVKLREHLELMYQMQGGI